VRYFIIAFVSSLLFTNLTVAQVVKIDFTIPDTVCVEELFAPKNNSSGSITNYFWHFCSGNLNYAPTGQPLAADNNLKGPAFMAMAQDTGEY